MRVGFVLQDPERRPTGLDVYTQNLWDALGEQAEGIELISVTLPARWAARAVLRVLWEQLFLPLWALVNRIDVLHVPAGSVPIARRRPSVMTLHDLGDPSASAYRSSLGPRCYFGWVVPASARFATRIVADSEATKRDAVERLGIPEERIDVVPLAASPAFGKLAEREVARVLDRLGITRPYFLQVGAPVARKNVAGCLRGFARFVARRPEAEIDIVIAGGDGRALPEAPDEAQALLERGRVHRLGHVALDDLVALYNGACAVVLPSFYEGFGFPLVEAFACGTPAIASRVASLPEVGGDAALYVDPNDPNTIAEAMERYATSPALRVDMARRAEARSDRFTWRATAERTLAAYRTAAGAGPAAGDGLKVLFIRLDSLGDVVLTTPCFAAVTRRYPAARVDVLVQPEAAPVLEGSRHVDRVLTMQAPWRGHARPGAFVGALVMIRRLRRERYDYVITPRRDLDDALFARCCGGKETLGFHARRTAPLLSRSIAFDERQHTVDNHLRLMSLLGCETDSLSPTVECGADTAALLPCVGERPLIGVAPFASSDAKALDPVWTAVLLDRLGEALDGELVLLGGPNDRGRAEAIVRRTSARVTDLVGRTSVPELCEVLRRCDALICADSAPMHLAAAVGTPAVALFGNEDPALWGPSGDAPHRVLQTSGRIGGGPPPSVPHDVALSALRAVLEEGACAPALDREEVAA